MLRDRLSFIGEWSVCGGGGGGEAEDFADGERVIAELIPTAEIFNGDTRLSGDFA